MCEIPEHVAKSARSTIRSILPTKSKDLYKRQYGNFIEWMAQKNCSEVNETVVLAYFHELSKNFKSNTLWSKCSMLKSAILSETNTDISKYPKLIAFLKNQSSTDIYTQSKVLTAENISKFIDEAPDNIYLSKKVIVILGFLGALRREEIYNITLEHVTCTEEIANILIPNKNNINRRSFVINGIFFQTFKKYYQIRTAKQMTRDNFLLKFSNGNCHNQPIGINTIGAVPRVIAEYLGLSDSKNCTLRAMRGANLEILETNEESISSPDVKRLKLESSCSKSNSEMQRNILKRLRGNFDSMTRDDLENLIAMKICEIIINNSEFKELRTIVENQSKTIKSYKDQLISLVKQYDKLKQIIKYLTSAIKHNNKKPLQITRNIGEVSLAPKLNVPLQGVIDKTGQFLSPTEKERASSTTSQMTTRNSSMQHRSMELNKNSDSKPKIVFVNSGNTVLNAYENTSTMKLSKNLKIIPRNLSNTVVKSSERLSSNEDPNINSLFKDVTISSEESLPIFSNSIATIARKSINSTEEYMVDRKAVVSSHQSKINKLCGAKKFPSKTISSNCNNTVTQKMIKNDPDEPSFSYLKTYECYKNWKNKRGVSWCSEAVLLSYFYDISDRYSPSSLWTIYSHLRSTLLSKENVNIANYVKLKTYLVNKNSEYIQKNKKHKNIISQRDVNIFLTKAPDLVYLATKAVIAVALSGISQTSEIHGLTINDIVFSKNEKATIIIPNSKVDKIKIFSVTGDLYKILKKYADIRPKDVTTQNFFLKYLNGMCYDKIIDINNLITVPRIIASYLNLPDPKSYTELFGCPFNFQK